MAVLNTTSPTARPLAPTDSPSNTVPSSRTRIAGWVTSFAFRWRSPVAGPARGGLQKTADWHLSGPGMGGNRRAGIVPATPPKGNAAVHAANGFARRSALAEKQVAQGVQARWAARQRGGRLQRAAGEDVAAGGAVHEFDALALPGELHRVLADDVAGAHAGIPRLGAAADGRLAQGQGGARGGILLVHVVLFDDVAVPAGQRARGLLDQFVQHRHAHTEVGGPKHGD